MRKQNFVFLFSAVSAYSLLANAACAGVSERIGSEQNFLYGAQDIDSLIAPLNLNKFSTKHNIKVAQVCWIMDTGECLGSSFGWDDQTPGVTPPDNYDPKDETDCIKEGYTLTSCPEGYEPNKFCMYDSRYFAECVPACPSDYKVCEDPYYGVGEPCNGKYKECQCDECVGYEYTADNIPDGYIISGEACNSCDGPKYKVIPNPCDGFLDCGDMGCESGATTCQSGDKTLCSNCRPCPNECDLSSCPANGSCDYEDCSGKYCLKSCNEGYDWNETTKSCEKSCLEGCTYASCPSGFTCEQDPCTGKYCKIGCTSTSQWFSEETGECCSTSYLYDDNNCSLTSNYHCNSDCGNKYNDCLALPSQNPVLVYKSYFTDVESKCPSGKFSDAKSSTSYALYNGKYYECLDTNIDNECLTIIDKIANYDMTKDLYCGNYYMYQNNRSNGFNVNINGNNKTLKFSGFNNTIFGGAITIENANLVLENRLHSLPFDVLWTGCDTSTKIGTSGTLKNVNVTTIGGIYIGGNIEEIVNIDATITGSSFTGIVKKDATLNFYNPGENTAKNYNGAGSLNGATIENGATMNLKNINSVTNLSFFGNSTINICNDSSIDKVSFQINGGREYEYTGGDRFCGTLTINSNKPVSLTTMRPSGSYCGLDHVQLNVGDNLGCQ